MTTRHVSVRTTCYGHQEWSYEVLEAVCEPGRPASWWSLETKVGTLAEVRAAAHRALDVMIEHELQDRVSDDPDL